MPHAMTVCGIFCAPGNRKNCTGAGNIKGEDTVEKAEGEVRFLRRNSVYFCVRMQGGQGAFTLLNSEDPGAGSAAAVQHLPAKAGDR